MADEKVFDRFVLSDGREFDTAAETVDALGDTPCDVLILGLLLGLLDADPGKHLAGRALPMSLAEMEYLATKEAARAAGEPKVAHRTPWGTVEDVYASEAALLNERLKVMGQRGRYRRVEETVVDGGAQ